MRKPCAHTVPTHRRHTPAPHHAKNPVDAVKRINRRWIVHGGLRASTTKYLALLEASDPERLQRSCELAMALVHSAADRDPKPWFYAGVFAMATQDEAARFLSKHPLTRTTWELVNDAPARGKTPASVRALAVRIAREIHRTMVPG